MAIILNRVTLQAVRDAFPRTIYYCETGCWWTHVAAQAGRPVDGQHRCPAGHPVVADADVAGFLAAAEAYPGHYGRHGTVALMAAHAENCIADATTRASACLPAWEDYNALLDAQLGGPVDALAERGAS